MPDAITKEENPLGTKPLGGLLFSLAVPSIIANVVNSLCNIPHRLEDLVKSSSTLAELVTAEGAVTASGLYYDRSTQTCPSSELSYSQENAAEP